MSVVLVPTEPHSADLDLGNLHFPDPPLDVRIDEACRLLSLGRTKVHELIAKGELRSTGTGRMRRICRESIDEYRVRHRAGVADR